VRPRPGKSASSFVWLKDKAGMCVSWPTPSGCRFLNTGELERLTGHPIRSEYKEPGTPNVLPPPDAIVVAPATVNTINKWAAGICDTLALGLLVDA
jgi:phosphopantothenoylcysteine decarboxylase